MCFRKLPLEGDNSISQSLCRWASTGVLHTVKSPCPQDIMLLFESIWLSFHLFYRPPPLYAKGGTFPRLTLHTQHGTLSQTLSECFFNSFHPSCISKLMTYVSHSVLTHTFCTFPMCWELQQVQRQKHISKAAVLKVLTIHRGKRPTEWPLLFFSVRVRFALSQGEPWFNRPFNPSNKNSGLELYFSQFWLQSKYESWNAHEGEAEGFSM